MSDLTLVKYAHQFKKLRRDYKFGGAPHKPILLLAVAQLIAKGEIIDRRHMLSGAIAKDRILAVPFTRGSSTTTAVLLEAIRAKTAPAAIITTDTDFFFALASVVANELYASPLPLVALSEDDFARLKTNDNVRVTTNGAVIVER